MFTGIIESMGEIMDIGTEKGNRVFWVSAPLSASVIIDQSIAHDGVCLTVDQLGHNAHRVTAVEETLKKTNLGSWERGSFVNLERCLLMNGRLDGHIVQGHVDTTAYYSKKKELPGSWELEFEFPEKFSHLIVEKGSVCVNGISLTAFDVGKKAFRVAIIPYTFEHTNIKYLQEGSSVNIEFDLIGKYVSRWKDQYQGK